MTYFGVRHQAAAASAREHRRDVRTERVEAYSAFIESAQEAHDALIEASVVAQDLGSASDETELLEDAESLLEHLQAARSAIGTAAKWQAKLLVLGPLGLAESSHNVLQALRAHVSAFGGIITGLTDRVDGASYLREREDELRQSWADTFGSFTAQAAHAVGGGEISQ
ncbi:hypothetical protein [Streptomyces sp. NPDC059786]|uniref:hypothetical protein n=1 Tax=Streptomyces sp. NPDC059786 TaxID=3346946 RepID=UPI00365E7F4B